ncbi:thermonuclease family protein [Minwuia sp. IMCC3009]|uniref:thermonuclease family protein n=1 Tax=Minwuia sp. IMCC3009 TaxID=3040674 RepID=UPI0024783811|nr:thermonuclease family protein [Minwuia sp. IMCC3009]
MIILTRVVVLLPILLWQAAVAEEIVGRVSVTDGDTVVIHGERIRLHGIDAAESAQTCEAGGKVWRCGQQASLALAERIGHLRVRCETFQRDRYGRVIAICRQGQTDLNRWMVRNGWAVAYRRYSTDYVAAENEASQAGRGIWRGHFVPPWDWRRGDRLGVTSPSRPPATSTSGPDRDCGDFRTWVEAQWFFEAAGPGDPHRLDGDRDGVACERLR